MSAASTIARLHTAAVYLQLAAERFHLMGEPINAEEATQASIMARVLADRLAMHEVPQAQAPPHERPEVV